MKGRNSSKPFSFDEALSIKNTILNEIANALLNLASYSPENVFKDFEDGGKTKKYKELLFNIAKRHNLTLMIKTNDYQLELTPQYIKEEFNYKGIKYTYYEEYKKEE